MLSDMVVWIVVIDNNSDHATAKQGKWKILKATYTQMDVWQKFQLVRQDEIKKNWKIDKYKLFSQILARNYYHKQSPNPLLNGMKSKGKLPFTLARVLRPQIG